MNPPIGAKLYYFLPPQKKIRIAVIALGFITILIALLILIGWRSDLPSHLGFPFVSTGMNPMSALSFILAGIAAILLGIRPSLFKYKIFIRAIAWFFVVEGLLRFAEAFGIADLQFDLLFFSQQFAQSQIGNAIVRMSYISALAFILTGLSFLIKLSHPARQNILQNLLFTIIVIAVFTLISVVYDVHSAYFGPLSVLKMALSNALCFFLIAVALLLDDYDKGIMAVITSNKTGGRMARIFLPLVLLFPVLVGLIDRLAEESGLFRNSLGLAFFAIAMMILFFIIIIRSARSNNDIHGQLMREIEERKKAEEDAHDSNRFVNAIYENIPNMVFVKAGEELRYKSINKAGEDLIGFTREQLLGKCDHDFFPKDEADFFRTKDKEVFATMQPVIAEERITSAIHGLRWLRTKKIGVRDDNGNPLYMIGISEDITELKEKQEQLNHYNTELEEKIAERTLELKLNEEKLITSQDILQSLNNQLTESNKELEQFAYVASHDLQEPLRMVSSFLQLLERKYSGQLDETARQYIHFAVNGSERMKALINDLLKLSRVGTDTNVTVPVDCNTVVQNVLKIYEEQIKETGAVIKVSHLPVIKAIKTQVEQLFQNLIGNALKYRGRDAPLIAIGCNAEGKKWQFYVQDNGIGIERKFFDKVFVIFQRLHGKNEYSGTGIGLAICKKIVEKHGGKIWVESEPDKGSVFNFTFPGR